MEIKKTKIIDLNTTANYFFLSFRIRVYSAVSYKGDNLSFTVKFSLSHAKTV